mgnify:CR=1 FL=1
MILTTATLTAMGNGFLGTANLVGLIAQGAGAGKTEALAGFSTALTIIKWIATLIGISMIIAGGMKMSKQGSEEGKMALIGGAVVAGAPHIVSFLMGGKGEDDLKDW